MINAKTLMVLGGLALLAVGAAVFVETRDANRSAVLEQQGQRLLPDLAKRLNDVAEVQVRSGEQTVTLTRRDNRWLIAERSNFPADPGKVRALLLGIANLTIVEPKTNNAELLSQLGLEDPTAAGAQSMLVTLKDGQGNALAAVVFGKDRPGKGSLDRTERYARRADSDQAWLVEGRVTLDKRAPDWMSKVLTNLDNQRIKQVKIEHADGAEVLRLTKESSNTGDFQIVEPKTDKPVKAPFELNGVANTFAKLTFDDVKPIAEVDFAKAPLYVATLETFDGLTLTLRTARVGEQTFGRLQAQSTAPTPAPTESAQDQQSAGEKPDEVPPSATTPAEATQAPSQTQDNTKAQPSPVDTAKEAADLNARFADWAFQLPLYQVEGIGKRLKDLLEEPAPEPAPSDS